MYSILCQHLRRRLVGILALDKATRSREFGTFTSPIRKMFCSLLVALHGLRRQGGHAEAQGRSRLTYLSLVALGLAS